MSNHRNILEIINLSVSARLFLEEQMRYLQENGYNVHLICTPDSNIEEFVKNLGVRYYPVMLNRGLTPLIDIKSFFEVLWYIRKNKVDTIISHQIKATLLGMLAAWLSRVPNRIYFAHGVFQDTLKGWKLNVFLFVARTYAKMFTKVICVSPSVMKRRLYFKLDKPEKQYIINKGTCGLIDTKIELNPERIHPNVLSIKKQELNIDSTDFVIGFCGRIVRDKGIEELLEAYSLLRANYPKKGIKLLIIGEKEKRNSISNKSSGILNNTEGIVFTGNVKHEDIIYYLKMMDVLTLPSYREGFPTVVLEAAAIGTPCIVSRSTGCIDSIVENETGVYCDISPESIAESIERFFVDSFKDQLSVNCRPYVVENFERTKLMPFFQEILEKGKNTYYA